MPQVSRIKLNKQVEKHLLNTLELIFSRIDKKEDMNLFLISLFTPTEKLMFAKRIAMVVLLKEELTDSQIAGALNITRMTVSKMRLFLQVKGQGYEIVFKILRNEKLMKEFKNALLKLTNYTVRAAGGYVKL